MKTTNLKRFAISEQNDNLLMNECKIEFLKHHPEFKDLPLSRNFLIGKLIAHYLR